MVYSMNNNKYIVSTVILGWSNDVKDFFKNLTKLEFKFESFLLTQVDLIFQVKFTLFKLSQVDFV